MSDNKLIDNGTLTDVTWATDDIGGVDYQRVKISVGADGVANDMAAPADGMSAANALASSHLVWNGATLARSKSIDATTDAHNGVGVPAESLLLYNGASWDRQRGNLEGALLGSAARTATTTSPIQTNYNHRGVAVYFLATVVGTGTIQISITGYVNALGFTAAAGVAVSSSAAVLLMYPGVVDADTSVDARSVVLPRSWDATITKSDTSSWTYQVTYALIL